MIKDLQTGTLPTALLPNVIYIERTLDGTPFGVTKDIKAASEEEKLTPS